MYDLLFDPPIWLPLGIILIASYLFWSGNRKQDKTLRNVGLGGVGLAIAVMVVAYFVDTPREQALNKTRLLIDSVEKRDWTTFGSLLDSRTRFFFYRGKQQLATGAQQSAEQVGIKTVRVLSMDAEQNQTRITVTTRVLSDQEAMSYPMPTDWRFSWQNDGTGWYLDLIEYIPNANLRPEQVERRLVMPR